MIPTPPEQTLLADELEHAGTQAWQSAPDAPYARDADPRPAAVQILNTLPAPDFLYWRNHPTPLRQLADGRWQLEAAHPLVTFRGRPVLGMEPVTLPARFSLDFVETWIATPVLTSPGPYRWAITVEYALREHNAPMIGEHESGTPDPTDPRFQDELWIEGLPTSASPTLGTRYHTRIATVPPVPEL